MHLQMPTSRKRSTSLITGRIPTKLLPRQHAKLIKCWDPSQIHLYKKHKKHREDNKKQMFLILNLSFSLFSPVFATPPVTNPWTCIDVPLLSILWQNSAPLSVFKSENVSCLRHSQGRDKNNNAASVTVAKPCKTMQNQHLTTDRPKVIHLFGRLFGSNVLHAVLAIHSSDEHGWAFQVSSKDPSWNEDVEEPRRHGVDDALNALWIQS